MAEATITLNFKIDDKSKDSSQESISAEVVASDNIRDNATAGTTEPVYSVPLYFRVYSSPTGLPYECIPSDGTVSPRTGNGTGAIGEVEEKLQFAMKREASVNKPVLSGNLTSTSWVGNDLGVLYVEDDNKICCSRDGVGIAKVKYNTQFQLHSFILSPRTDPEYEVLIYIRSTKGVSC